ncbi:MAG: hypothetical protein HYV08_16385 [Deltaproteobacteria bacterium]|nr:hypothetical protein [Deltaproteobacteria bacterium]
MLHRAEVIHALAGTLQEEAGITLCLAARDADGQEVVVEATDILGMTSLGLYDQPVTFIAEGDRPAWLLDQALAVMAEMIEELSRRPEPAGRKASLVIPKHSLQGLLEAARPYSTSRKTLSAQPTPP